MSEISEWPCWRIRQCSGRENCPAGAGNGQACWEVVGSQDFFLADICSDCLVYVIKKGNAVLTDMDLKKIHHSRSCKDTCCLLPA